MRRKTRTCAMAIAGLLAATTYSAAARNPPLPVNPTAEPGSRFRECRDCPEMVVVPAGSFNMGSPEDEKGRFVNEGPQHQVIVVRHFAMSANLVTRAEYARFVRTTRRPTPDSCRVYDVSFADSDLVRVRGKNWQRPNFSQAKNHPVVCVTWDDATAYAAWLNAQIGQPAKILYRLPSEAEWEYAARGGTATPYYWGNDILRSQANYGPDEVRFAPVAMGADRWAYTSPVGAFPANPFGLYDMAGNVWQFTQDCWRDSYSGAPVDGSARSGGKCDERVVRGGSWFKPPSGERSAKRGQAKVADLKGNHEIGFRLIRDLPQ